MKNELLFYGRIIGILALALVFCDVAQTLFPSITGNAIDLPSLPPPPPMPQAGYSEESIAFLPPEPQSPSPIFVTEQSSASSGGWAYIVIVTAIIIAALAGAGYIAYLLLNRVKTSTYVPPFVQNNPKQDLPQVRSDDLQEIESAINRLKLPKVEPKPVKPEEISNVIENTPIKTAEVSHKYY